MQPNEQSFEELTRWAIPDAEENQKYWDAVEILANRIDDETVQGVWELSNGDIGQRQFAAAVMGRLTHPEEFMFPDITERLLEMLKTEKHETVLVSIIAALTRRPNDLTIFEILKKYSTNPNESLRWFVADGFGEYHTEESAYLLMQLMEDEAPRVRDWATFQLGNIPLDSPIIRDAFIQRLEDKDDQTFLEALRRLAERNGERVIAPVLDLFDENGCSYFFELSDDSPDYRLLPALKEIRDNPDYKGNRTELEKAIELCEG